MISPPSDTRVHILVAGIVLSILFSPSISYPETQRTPPEIKGVRIEPGEITIDGRLDEPAWNRAEPVDGFTQREPVPGRPASERTEVRILYDRENLYIGAMLYDSDPSGIIGDERRRDADLRRNDAFAVLIDTYHDHRNGFFFETNPVGARAEAIVFDEGRELNFDWDGIWWVESRITDEGWQVEMRIPFSTLRFDRERIETWGLQMRRLIRRKNEEVYWSGIHLDASMWRVSLAGHLTGLEDIRPGRNIEIKPYILSGVERVPSIGMDDTRVVKDGGVDIKYALTPHLTLDLTVNTDFAQVEADELKINITRFPLFFPEKREFFLEGSGFFEFGLRARLQPFFSRRIGISGGKEIPILVGGKLTGKAGRYGIGVLSVETRKKGDEPRTNYSVVRIKRDILDRSKIGFIAISKEPDEGPFNRTFGVDANLVFMDYLYINSFLLKTQTQGSKGDDMARYLNVIWLDPYRYFKVSHLDVEDRFNPEVGFVRRRGIKESSLYGEVFMRPERSIVRQYSFYGLMKYISDQEDMVIGRNGDIGFTLTFHSGEDFRIAYKREFDRLDFDFDIRPGITIPEGGYSFHSLYVRLSTDRRRRVSAWMAFERGSYYDGDRVSYDWSFNLRPTRYLRVSPGLKREEVDLPWGSFTANLVNTTIEYTISTKAFLNALLQWNDDMEEASVNLRFNYQYRPGSDIYVVYNERRDTFEGGFVDRALVVKLTYLWSF